MSVDIGWTPTGLTITLNPGVKFAPPGIQLKNAAGVAVDWPVGTAARLVLTSDDPVFSTTWNAIITASILTWDEAIVDVATVPDGAHAQLYLTYGTSPEVLWASGGVVWRS